MPNAVIVDMHNKDHRSHWMRARFVNSHLVRHKFHIKKLDEEILISELRLTLDIRHVTDKDTFISLKALKASLAIDFTTEKSLQTLHLEHLEQVSQLNSSLWGLRSLLYLHLDSMPVTHISDSIGDLTRLLSLKLRNLSIRDLPLGMAGLLALQNFSMTECACCRTSNGVLASMRMLRTIELKIPLTGHAVVFVEVAAALAGLQALQTLELEGLLESVSQTHIRDTLMQPPESLQSVHVNGKFFDFWRQDYECNKGLQLYEMPLTFAKQLQQRTLMFVASRWTRGGQVGNEMPPDVIRKICALANDGTPPQDAVLPEDDETWV